MSIADKLSASQNALANLLDFANAKTGKADINIGDAIKTLCDGYGQSNCSIIEKSITYDVENYASYDTFYEFMRVYPLPIKQYTFIRYRYDFIDNTSNNRAGIYVNGFRTEKEGVLQEKGERVGGTCGGEYGCDVYPGSKISISCKAYLEG